MGNRLFSALAVLVMGFLVFAFAAVQKNNTAVLNRVAEQQEMILGIKKEAPVSTPKPAVQAVIASDSGEVAALKAKIAALEARLSSLETDAKPILDQVKAQQAAYEKQRKEMEEAMKKVHEIPVGNSPIRGNADAPVTLTVFTDFQCPYCSRFHGLTDELLKAYPGQVKLILKNFPLPFHQEAKPAAKAVLAAKEQGKYWEMVDAILEDNSALSAAKYQELAKKIGLNVEKFNKDLKSKELEYEKIITDDMALAVKVSVRGTPSFYLNGRMSQPDLGMLKSQVEEALKK